MEVAYIVAISLIGTYLITSVIGALVEDDSIFEIIKKRLLTYERNHQWTNHGWSSIRCVKCGKKKYNPGKNSEILNGTLTRMVDKGIWDRDDVNKVFGKRGHFIR